MPIALDPNFRYQGTKDEANTLVFAEVAQMPALSENFKVVEGIKGRQALHTINRIGKITHTDPGCDPTYQPLSLTTNLKLWDPVDLEAAVYECWSTFRGKAEEWNLKVGNDKYDFSASVMEDVIINEIKYASFADTKRFAWFGNKAITAAQLTNGAGDVSNYNAVDGIWVQAFAAVAAGKSKRVPVSDNTYNATTNPLQDVAPGDAYPLFADIFDKAPQKVKALSVADRRFQVSDSFFTAYQRYRESQNLDTSYTVQGDGITTLKFRGVPIQVVNEWDSIISADFFKSGARDLPNRAIYGQKDVLQVGFDAMPQAGQDDNPFLAWYDIKTKYMYARLNYVMDTKLADEDAVIFAY